MQLPYEQAKNLAKPLEDSNVDDLLRIQQAFVDRSIANATPAPPLHIPQKQPQPPPAPKAKKQPAKRRSADDTLSDVNWRALPLTSKRIPKQTQKYKDFI